MYGLHLLNAHTTESTASWLSWLCSSLHSTDMNLYLLLHPVTTQHKPRVTHFKQPLVHLLAVNHQCYLEEQWKIGWYHDFCGLGCRVKTQVISLLLCCWKPWALLNHISATSLSLSIWRREESNVTQLHWFFFTFIDRSLTSIHISDTVNSSVQNTCAHLRLRVDTWQ